MLKRVLSIATITLLVVSTGLGIYTFIRCGQLNPKVDTEELVTVIQPIFTWMYVLIFIAIAALIIAPIPHMIKNPKGMKNFGIGILAMIILFGVTYLLSSDAPLPFLEDAAAKNSYSRLADLNLLSMYIVCALAIAGVLFSVLWGALKPNK